MGGGGVEGVVGVGATAKGFNTSEKRLHIFQTHCEVWIGYSDDKIQTISDPQGTCVLD